MQRKWQDDRIARLKAEKSALEDKVGGFGVENRELEEREGKYKLKIEILEQSLAEKKTTRKSNNSAEKRLEETKKKIAEMVDLVGGRGPLRNQPKAQRPRPRDLLAALSTKEFYINDDEHDTDVQWLTGEKEELEERVETLEARVKALVSGITDLKNRLSEREYEIELLEQALAEEKKRQKGGVDAEQRLGEMKEKLAELFG
ncbi:hypothetical protein CC86DRAFT_379415 [Ophiobolus disseminans]|uniref:Uncharacterized protein n=1 Tax=Ophiobolus disseminans TaxID=1469910 RepID=A0A6A7ABE6_9PLEO|nr:hypothetical protein CC86DRAFT_379415 [Ophiobolus disseminans]